MSRNCNKTSPSGNGGESLWCDEKVRRNTKGYDTSCETSGDYSSNFSPTEREDRKNTRVEAQANVCSRMLASTRRELQYQTENLKLRLENVKLKMVIESKTDLLSKLKKDFHMLKRSLKLVLKSLNETTKDPEINLGNFCHDHEEFGSPRKKDFQASTRNSSNNSVLENGADSKHFDYASTLRSNTV
ncbi:hypothetical protein EVAR_65937_1 [Eumeta japonica]|uniref:Uncharacterized protein n=1 Tax=Eumeta variegata TaxID=151549 RepID=A0A4C2AC47_EUMVA|nr:hypothetical protein EVAR_65937_1 [Eumeta japonica]